MIISVHIIFKKCKNQVTLDAEIWEAHFYNIYCDQ
jgi:hypothetical protein